MKLVNNYTLTATKLPSLRINLIKCNLRTTCPLNRTLKTQMTNFITFKIWNVEGKMLYGKTAFE